MCGPLCGENDVRSGRGALAHLSRAGHAPRVDTRTPRACSHSAAADRGVRRTELAIRRGCWSRKTRLCGPVRRTTPRRVRCTAERVCGSPFQVFQTWVVTPGLVTDSSGDAWRGRGPPHWRRQEVSHRGDQMAPGCQPALPAGEPVRRHSSDWPTCWDFRSRVSLSWCGARPRGHDGVHAGATAALPMSPPALEPSREPSPEPSRLKDNSFPSAASCTPVLPPADWRAAKRDRPHPGVRRPGRSRCLHPDPGPNVAPRPAR